MAFIMKLYTTLLCAGPVAAMRGGLMKRSKITSVTLICALLLASCSSDATPATTLDPAPTTAAATSSEATSEEETATEAPAPSYPDTFEGLIEYMLDSEAVVSWMEDMNSAEGSLGDCECWWYNDQQQSVYDAIYADEPGVVNYTFVTSYLDYESYIDHEGDVCYFFLYELDPDQLEIYDGDYYPGAELTYNTVQRDTLNVDREDLSALTPLERWGYVFDDNGAPVISETSARWVTFNAVNGNYALVVTVITESDYGYTEYPYLDPGTSDRAEEIIEAFSNFNA